LLFEEWFLLPAQFLFALAEGRSPLSLTQRPSKEMFAPWHYFTALPSMV
jgi:hypothetical protein